MKASSPRPDGAATLPRRAPLRDRRPSRVELDPGDGRRIVRPAASAVAEAIALIPIGQVLTLEALGEGLAHCFDAHDCAPADLDAAIGAVAAAVADALAQGEPAPWPVWRVVRADGTLAGRWPLDARYRAALLRAEGHVITWSGRAWKVLGIGPAD